MKEKDSVEERERGKAIRGRRKGERKASVLRRWSFQQREERAEKMSSEGH